MFRGSFGNAYSLRAESHRDTSPGSILMSRPMRMQRSRPVAIRRRTVFSLTPHRAATWRTVSRPSCSRVLRAGPFAVGTCSRMETSGGVVARFLRRGRQQPEPLGHDGTRHLHVAGDLPDRGPLQLHFSECTGKTAHPRAAKRMADLHWTLGHRLRMFPRLRHGSHSSWSRLLSRSRYHFKR